MKYYCRYCYSYDIFILPDRKNRKDWALCRSCGKTAPLENFYIDHDSGFWDHIDDWIKESKPFRKIDN